MVALLGGASFLAGALNAVAGGGTFLTFPALVFAGVPVIAANATSAVGVLPGYVSGAIAFRREIAPVQGLGVAALAALGLLGGLVGALLLLITPPAAFDAIVPWLLLLATGLFAAGPRMLKRMNGAVFGGKPAAIAALFAVSIYGGYFNGGLGILLLALFGLLGLHDLSTMNGLKNILSAVMAVVASIAFAWAGVVAWPEAVVIMIASTAGGHAGAVLSRRIPPAWLRLAIVLIGLVISATFFARA